MLQAKTNLSKLVEAVESGAEQEIIIAPQRQACGTAGADQGDKHCKAWLAAGKYADFSLEKFNALDAEIERLFNESEIFPDDDDESAA